MMIQPGRRGTPQSLSDQGDSGVTECSVEDIVARHGNEWIMLRVTEFDEDQWPIKGVVVAHSPDREAISAALAADDAFQTHYVFQAVPHLRSGAEYDRVVKEFAAQFAASKGTAGADRLR